MAAKVYCYTGTATDPLQVWQNLNLSGDAWWFGWSETEMHLPQPLNGDLPNADWERLSIFNNEVELRLLLHNNSPTILLLAEQSPLLPNEWRVCEEYPEYDEAQHILLGDPPVSGGKTTRLVDVVYPTVFDYGVELAPSSTKRNRVVAQVRYYYDSAHRLRYIRYAGVETYNW